MTLQALLQRLQPAGNARRILHGLGWTTLAQAASMVLRLGSSLLLTRLLAPEAYGTIGPALAVLVTLEWFSDLGIRQALVRDPLGGTPELLNAGWWIGLFRAFCLAAIVGGLAFPLREFYERPDLAGVLLALAFLPVLQALRSPGLPVLRREMNYRALFVLEIGQTFSSIAITLVAAAILHSVWAMAIGILSGAAIEAAISYWLAPMRPGWSRDAHSVRRILTVSRQVTLNTLAMALVLNADRLLGLRLVSVAEMGLYTVAWSLAAAFDSLLGRACDVYYAHLARTADAARQALHEKVCFGFALLGGAALAIAVAVAPWLLRQLYDPRYAGAGVLFAVLIARLIPRALGQMQFQILMVRAEIRVATISYFAALVVEAALIYPFAHAWGGLGLALASLAAVAAVTGLQSLILWRRGECRLLPATIAFAWLIAALAILHGLN